MSESERSSRPSWNISEHQVVIVGAGYGALITGAILLREGIRPLLLTDLDRAGLAGGAYPFSPVTGGTWWLDFGRRDSHGEQDFVLVTREWHLRVAQRAGVTLPLVGPLEPTMRTHQLPDGIVSSFSVSDPRQTERFLEETLGLDAALRPRFIELLGSFAQMPADQAEKLINETFESWFARHHSPVDIRQAMYALLVCIYSLPPEQTSVGRFALHYARSAFNLYLMNDVEVGGMQGACQPYIRALEAGSAGILTNLKATTLLRDSQGAVSGLIARTTHGFVRELRTRTIIFAEPAFRLLDLVPAGVLPPAFVAQAMSTRQWEMPMVNLYLGLSAAPIRRGDGKPDDFQSWNRVMLGPQRIYGGGWIISSLASRQAAPHGKHLMEICFADNGTKRSNGQLAKMSYEELKAGMDQLVDYLHGFYIGLSDITEWAEYSYTIEAGGHHWAYKAGDRVPVVAPIPGLYMQGYTTDSPSAYYEAEEASADNVATLVRERLRGGR